MNLSECIMLHFVVIYLWEMVKPIPSSLVLESTVDSTEK